MEVDLTPHGPAACPLPPSTLGKKNMTNEVMTIARATEAATDLLKDLVRLDRSGASLDAEDMPVTFLALTGLILIALEALGASPAGREYSSLPFGAREDFKE